MKLKIVNFLAILILFAGFFTINSKAFAAQNINYNNFNSFKIVFLPDAHVSFKEEDSWILYKESFVIFQDVITSLKNIAGLDYVVFGGDLLNNDDNELGDLPLVLDSLDNLNFKYYSIFGDREADLKEDYTKQDFCSEFRSNGFDNPNMTYWAQQPAPNLLFIGLDTSINNKFSGKIPDDELFWLNDILKSNPDKFTVIYMHHPAVTTTEADKFLWKDFILENSSEFMKIINKYPQVKLIFSGHHHNFAVQNINNKLFVSIPSIVTYPNSYKIIKVFPDKVEIENKDISFKQIIKKSKNILVKTEYAKQFDAKKPKKVLELQKGTEYSKNKVYYFEK